MEGFMSSNGKIDLKSLQLNGKIYPRAAIFFRVKDFHHIVVVGTDELCNEILSFLYDTDEKGGIKNPEAPHTLRVKTDGRYFDPEEFRKEALSTLDFLVEPVLLSTSW